MKYANYNEGTRRIIGWYDDEIHAEIPKPNIGITDSVWQNAINSNHNKINEDGTTCLADFKTESETIEANKQTTKQAIAQQLATLTVTTSNGNVFDATSQARQDMADAILASTTLVRTTTTWRMADNSDIVITIDELKEAHALAILEYAKIKGIGV